MTNAVTNSLIEGASIVLTANRARSHSSRQNGVANLGTFKKGTFVQIEIRKEGFNTFHDTIQAIGDSCTSIIEKPINPKLANSNDSRIVLEWAKNIPRDLDLRMEGDDDCHIFHYHKKCGKSSLDRDNTQGGLNGSETITVSDNRVKQLVYVIRHSNDGDMCASGAHVTIYSGKKEMIKIEVNGSKSKIWKANVNRVFALIF